MEPKSIATTPADFCETRQNTLVNVEVHLTDILLLCTECGEPIKARINTQQWIRVEWIGPEGECLKCYQEKKAKQ